MRVGLEKFPINEERMCETRRECVRECLEKFPINEGRMCEGMFGEVSNKRGENV